ncbi:unnamed protein product [Closterium sp. Naga37s-1]|nr:unnamed protein product [Closterium sp. Naga37s-1]
MSQGSQNGGTTNGSSEDVTNQGGGTQQAGSSGPISSSHGARASRGKLRQCIPVLSVVKLLLSSTNHMFSIGMVNEKDVVLCTPLAPTICQMVMSAFAVEAAMAVERALALNSDRPQLPASTSIHVGVVDQEELLASVRTKIKSIRPFWAAASARVFPFSAPTSPRGETVVGSGAEAGVSEEAGGGVDAAALMGAQNDVSMQDADIVASSINADVAPPVEITDFIPLKVLGKGSFAKVLLVRHAPSGQVFPMKVLDKAAVMRRQQIPVSYPVLLVRHAPSGQVFAMKVLDKAAVMRRQQLQHTLTERHVLQEVRHPFLVPLRWALQSETRLFLILDFMPGGELFFHLKRERRFKDDRARLYAAELLLALGHLHSLGVIYRDLKPENILLDAQGHVRIADFGLAKEHIADNSSASTFCGTPEYLAPEVLGGKGHGRAVDWWSLGILLFEMVVGVPPFYDRNVNIMYNKIVNAPLVFPVTVTNFYLRDLISKLLIREPSLRLGAGPTDAAEIMRHEFFRGMDWDRLYAREVPPPFVPSSKGMEDVSNFDKSFTGLHISDPLEPPSSAAPSDSHHGAAKPTNAPAKAAQTSSNEKAPAGTEKVNGGKTGKVGAKPNLKIDTHAASGMDPLDNSLFEGFVFSPTKKHSATN